MTLQARTRRPWRHREPPVKRMARRSELAPGDAAHNEALLSAAKRFREDWLKADLADTHRVEFAAARDALAVYDAEISRTIELVVLEEQHVSMLDRCIVAGRNPARRKIKIVARVCLGLRILLEHYATRPAWPAK